MPIMAFDKLDFNKILLICSVLVLIGFKAGKHASSSWAARNVRNVPPLLKIWSSPFCAPWQTLAF